MENKVRLIGYYGSDELIACSAWTSTSRDLTEEKRRRIPQMIQSLWKEGHQTPFEKGIVHFLVDTEIASHIQMLKHRIAVSINGESARYKELKEDKYYLPEDWAYSKPNRNEIFQNNRDLDWWLHLTNQKDHTWMQILEDYTKLGNLLYHQALKDLTPILGRKRAKESARFFKTYNSQIEGDISFNMRSFAHFLKLRNSDKAQLEIQEIAFTMLGLVSKIEGNPFKYTLKAFENEMVN